jgi:neutral ceramidase
MANARLDFVLGGAFTAALVLLLLFAVVPDNQPPIFDSRYKWADRDTEFASDDSVFLLGAGRADITGYDLLTHFLLIKILVLYSFYP